MDKNCFYRPPLFIIRSNEQETGNTVGWRAPRKTRWRNPWMELKTSKWPGKHLPRISRSHKSTQKTYFLLHSVLKETDSCRRLLYPPLPSIPSSTSLTFSFSPFFSQSSQYSLSSASSSLILSQSSQSSFSTSSSTFLLSLSLKIKSYFFISSSFILFAYPTSQSSFSTSFSSLSLSHSSKSSFSTSSSFISLLLSHFTIFLFHVILVCFISTISLPTIFLLHLLLLSYPLPFSQSSFPPPLYSSLPSLTSASSHSFIFSVWVVPVIVISPYLLLLLLHSHHYQLPRITSLSFLPCVFSYHSLCTWQSIAWAIQLVSLRIHL